ncbi:long-chain fatty acid--CoA ligase [Kiloniella litopenaei]|uniref:long-chain fatty acid--CoA ligase n=1 Tax=Kiloniella litopenaei TaxID=1549748 RepID=UPI003BAB577C
MSNKEKKPDLCVVGNAHVIAGNDIAWNAKASEQVDVEVYDTLPKILAYNAAHFPDDVAQREKEFGIWNRFTWKDFNDHVGRMALGMASLGVSQGDTVVLIGDNRVEWVWGEVAAHACRAMSMGIYRDALEDEIAYLTDYTEPKVVIAEDEEQVDKFLNLEDRIPSIKHIIYTDPRGMRKYDDPRLMSLEDLEKLGQASLDQDGNAYDLLISETNTDDVAVLCTTSGTTSNPKLSMWPHRAFLGHAASYLRADPKTSADEYLAVLPLSWVMEQMYSVAWNLISRMKVNFPEEQSTVMADLREVGPSFVLLAPRVWETIAADVRARMMDSSPWKQKMYDWGAKKALEALENGQKSSAAEWLLMRALRDRLGFKNLKSAATGGAAMGPDTFKFFLSMGIPLRQLYGQTEALGAHTIHKADDVNHETVGSPMPGVELRIDNPDKEGLGEIVVNHGNMMRGYYKNEAASKETFGDDGWFLTGDAGYFNDDGHLVVIDRIKDLASTTSGVKFSPQYIENKLKFSTYVAEAVILGADKPYLTAIICIRYPIVSKWAEKRRLRFTTYTDLSAQPAVYEQLRREVEMVNATLPPAQQIKKFLLLYKELDADDGELTRTRKVRRGVIADKYGDIIDRLYSDDDHVDIDTVIHFQDGSKQRIVTTLNIENLGSDGSSPRPEKQQAGGR